MHISSSCILTLTSTQAHTTVSVFQCSITKWPKCIIGYIYKCCFLDTYRLCSVVWYQVIKTSGESCNSALLMSVQFNSIDQKTSGTVSIDQSSVLTSVLTSVCVTLKASSSVCHQLSRECSVTARPCPLCPVAWSFTLLILLLIIIHFLLLFCIFWRSRCWFYSPVEIFALQQVKNCVLAKSWYIISPILLTTLFAAFNPLCTSW